MEIKNMCVFITEDYQILFTDLESYYLYSGVYCVYTEKYEKVVHSGK